MDQDSHSYYLIKQSENILTQLREQARKIETAEQKISTNLKNIRSGQNEMKPLYAQQNSTYENTSFGQYNNHINHSQHSNHSNPSYYYQNSHHQNSHQDYTQNNNTHQSHPVNISKTIRLCEEMDDIQQYSEQESYTGNSCTGPIQTSFKQSSHSSIKPQTNVQISFAHSYIRQSYTIPYCQIVFTPFNKLYKSPILQLKDKNRLILARKYKGSNIKVNDGKICDGKIYKFSKIITDEDELLETLTNCTSIGLIGSYQTLKKKIHMCLFIKYYQRLMQSICQSLSLDTTISIQYLELINKSAVVHIYEQFRFNTSTRKVQTSRISKVFENILENMIDRNKNNYYQKQKEKIKHRTRVIRIIQQQTEEKFQVVSSSNQNISLFEEFKFKKVVWCINPLVKHYEMTQNTLQFAKKIEEYDKGERIR